MSVLGMVSAIRRAAVYVRYGLITDIRGSDAERRFGVKYELKRPSHLCPLFEVERT